jgi:hypothetical protein
MFCDVASLQQRWQHCLAFRGPPTGAPFAKILDAPLLLLLSKLFVIIVALAWAMFFASLSTAV